MYRVVLISVALFFVGNACFGQRNEVDYVKKSEFDRVDYSDVNSPLFLSGIQINQENYQRYCYKEVWFNRDSTLRNYMLRQYPNEGYNDDHQELDMNYSFRNDGSLMYGIYHSRYDTVKVENHHISIEKTASTEKAELVVEFQKTGNDSTVFYTIPEEVVASYIDWIYSDLNRLDSLETPKWPDAKNWTPRKSRTTHVYQMNEGNVREWRSFYVDTYYHDMDVSIDTVLIQESYSNVDINDFETRSIITTRTDSIFHKEAFVYYPDRDSTEQEMLDLLHGDTVFRMLLTTKLTNGNLHSHYRIKRDAAFQSTNYYGQSNNAPIVLEREIWLERDSSGYISAGNARGIVVDDQFGNVAATTKLYFRDFMDNSGKNVLEGEKRPNHVNKQINNRAYTVQYNLISLDVNRDLKPLIDIKHLFSNTHNDSYNQIYFYPSPTMKNYQFREPRYKKPKKRRNTSNHYYELRAKRIQKDRKRGYEKWVGEQDEVVYEVFFVKK